MKNRKMYLVKTITRFMLVFLLVSAAACNGKGVEKKKSAKTIEKQSQPSVVIHTAAFMGNVEAIQQHIKFGSDLNAKDQYGSTPLIIAATFGKTEVAKALIEGGANLEVTNNEGSTPLHVAAFFCRTEIVKAMLAKGADKTIKNGNGQSAFETVAAPYNKVSAIYEYLNKELGPLGLRLNYERLEKTRPEIAELLQ